MRHLLLPLILTLWCPAPAAEEPRFVGADICIDCHSDPALGNQAATWTGSAHARSWILLETGYEEMISSRAKPFVEPGNGRGIREAALRLGSETACLQCHGAGARIDPERLEPTFHQEDGVQCEACHGPGSIHVALKRADPLSGGPHGIERGSTADCIVCHGAKASHDEVIGPRDFDLETMWPRIAHPRSNSEPGSG